MGNKYKLYFREACAIPEEESSSLVITGGKYSMRTASRYKIDGWQEDLGLLNIGRRKHGCSRYYKNEEEV